MNRDLDAEGYRVAREVAAWDLGDPEWADLLIDAYLNPERAEADLRAEQAEPEADT